MEAEKQKGYLANEIHEYIADFSSNSTFNEIFDPESNHRDGIKWQAFLESRTSDERQYVKKIINPMLRNDRFGKLKIGDRDRFAQLFDENRIDHMGPKIIRLAQIIFAED